MFTNRMVAEFHLLVLIGLQGWEERLKISDRAHIGK